MERAAGLGLSANHIGILIGTTGTVVRDLYCEEISRGEAMANLSVVNALFQTATDRSHSKHAACAIYWTKARMGWYEAPAPKDAPAAPDQSSTEHYTEDGKARFAEMMATLKG